MLTLFLKRGDDGGGPAPEDPGRITDSTAMEGHIHHRWFDCRQAPLVPVG
jgi:hypothetical protein